jgi:hypothetical protein
LPFTLAHTVASRPLWRASGRRLLLSAVVIGSVAPDLEYLVHLDTERTISHTWWGVLVLDLPVALILLALWHGLIKRPVADLFGPRTTGGRWSLLPSLDLRPFPFGPARRLALICVSILAGIATHLLWDSFTHRDGFITDRVAVLREAIGRPHVYDLFNYASTLAGILILTWWWGVAARRPCMGDGLLAVGVRRRWVAAIVAVTAAGGAANGLRLRFDGWGLETSVIGAVLGALSAGLVVVIAASAALRPRL